MLCRLCVFDCLQEHANLLDSQQISKLIAKYLPMELAPNNELKANIICNVCLQHLEDFEHFLSHIEKRQTAFKQLLLTKSEVFSKTDTEIVKPSAELTACDKAEVLSDSMSVLKFTFAPFDETKSDDLSEADMLLSEIKIKDSLSTPMKSKRTKQKSTKIKSEKSKKPTRANNSPEEDKRRDELVAKYISLDCELCHEKQQNYKQLQTHFQKTHNQKAFITCCGRKLSRRLHIIDHMEMHANPETFKCKECNKMLKSRVSLTHHVKLFHKHEALDCTCQICDRRFAYPSMLKAHMHVHNCKRFYNCDLCNKNFKTEISKKLHIKNMHGERILHICDMCGKEYRFKAAFEQHIAEHQGKLESKRQQCHICKIYVSINYIKRHIQRHETVEVACDECGKKSSSIPALQSHKERYHKKNQQTYDCTLCDKKFSRRRSLKEHIDMHTGNKAYTCKYCPREFRSKANMYAHAKKSHYDFWAQAQEERYKHPEELQTDK